MWCPRKPQPPTTRTEPRDCRDGGLEEAIVEGVKVRVKGQWVGDCLVGDASVVSWNFFDVPIPLGGISLCRI